MRKIAALTLIVALSVPSSMFAADETLVTGYSLNSSRTERNWEQKLRAIPNPANLREYMQHLSARPHHVGPLTIRKMPSGSSPTSSNGDGMRTSKRSMCCFRLRSFAFWR